MMKGQQCGMMHCPDETNGAANPRPYDPNAFVSFFEKLQEQGKQKPGRFAGWFRTHPATNDRIAASIDEQRYLTEKDNYIVNTSEFDRVKARLLAIDNADKAGDSTVTQHQKKPTLRRRSNTEDGREPDEGDQPPTKSRPTLKRPGDRPHAHE